MTQGENTVSFSEPPFHFRLQPLIFFHFVHEKEITVLERWAETILIIFLLIV